MINDRVKGDGDRGEGKGTVKVARIKDKWHALGQRTHWGDGPAVRDQCETSNFVDKRTISLLVRANILPARLWFATAKC